MSETLSATFADLLPSQIDGLGAQISAHVGDQPGAIAWRLVEDHAVEGLRTALAKIDLCEQLAQAWVTLSNVRACRDPAKVPRGNTAILSLGKHHLNLKATPALQLTVGGWKAPPLKLSYSVSVAMDSASLSVRDGELIGALPGDCATTASLSCGAVPLHDPWTIAQFKLPGRLTFSPGWAIP